MNKGVHSVRRIAVGLDERLFLFHEVILSRAYLILADGTVFEGSAVGAAGRVIGETVFTTGMTGYIETLTDPSFYGQIVTQTFPLIGNYGVCGGDFESGRSYVRGYVVREICGEPSNFRSGGGLDVFLREQGIVGIAGIDTRRLTKILREVGVMNGMIVSDGDCPAVDESLLSQIRGYRVTGAVEAVSGAEARREALRPTDSCPETNRSIVRLDGGRRIVLWDFGAKLNIRRELEKRGAEVVTVPYSCTAEQIQRLSPDGIMLSNGPGDPAENAAVIEEIRRLCGFGIPIFGICLGHQMLALARGARTAKLKYGHRGGNQPVKDLETGRVFISSQNHGYAVENESLPASARLRFINANDGTCEGIEYTDIPAFSVQFHPEACGGPHDTNYLFDVFMEMVMRGGAGNA